MWPEVVELYAFEGVDTLEKLVLTDENEIPVVALSAQVIGIGGIVL